MERPGEASITAAAPATPAAPQHMQALARANVVRLARAELKRAIARGTVSAAEVIEQAPWEAESMTIGELLTSQRRWGKTRSRRFLGEVSISDQKMLGSMTARQREELVAHLAARTVPRALATPQEEPRPESRAEWEELASISRRHKALADEIDRLTTRRDELIRGLSETGASRRSVAEAASLTVGRVQQIVDKRRPSAQPAVERALDREAP